MATTSRAIRAAVGRFYDSPKLWQYGHHMLNAPYGNTVTALPPTSCARRQTRMGALINLLNPWANTPGGDPLAAINYPHQGVSPVQLPPSTLQFPLNGDYVSMPIDADVMRVTSNGMCRISGSCWATRADRRDIHGEPHQRHLAWLRGKPLRVHPRQLRCRTVRTRRRRVRARIVPP